MLELLVILASCALVAIVVWPAFGAYLILSASPLIVGMARGSIPLRPNEMLLLLVMTALGIRTVLLMLSGRHHPQCFDRIDRALLLLVLTGSVMPVLWALVRSQPLSTDDLLYSFVLIKYYAVFRVFRTTIVAQPQITVCLWLSMTSAFLASLVAVLQVLNLLGILEFLQTYYEQPFDSPA